MAGGERPGAAPTARPGDARSRARMAISELFLDTAIEENDFARLRDELRSTGLSVRDLDEIYCNQVAPVLYRNLKSPAGVWSGFDAAWLDDEIRKNLKARRWSPLAYLRRFVATRSTINDWKRLRAMISPPVSELYRNT